MKPKPLLLGHRGCRDSSLTGHNSGLPVENSLAAFEYALAQGCDGFEFDVRQTRDRQNVIWHDSYWNRLPIVATDYARLSGPNGELLPTLDDVLQQFGHRAFLDIELKVRGAEMSVVEALRAVPPQCGFIVSSFLPDTLIRLNDIDSSLPLGYICERDYALAIWRNIPIQIVLPRCDLVEKELIDAAHRLGRQVGTWTVNSPSQMSQLAEWGIDGLISDDPALLYRTFHSDSEKRAASFTLVAMPTTGERFERAVSIMARLRGPGGCPWDREQTFDTIKPYTLEEAYEVIEAIDARDWPELGGELGDLLLQVLFYSQMAAEEQKFSIDDVLDRLSNKLVDRHPHVFGDVKADTSGEVLRNWQALKAEEKKKRQADGGENADAAKTGHPESVLHGISSAMPSLMAAYKISSRAAQVGFDWPNIEGLFGKLREETDELRKNLEEYPEPGPQPVGAASTASARGMKVSEELQERLEDEVGDLFFVLVNIARYLALDPESALRKTNRKFRRRFEYLEDRLREQGRKPADASLDEMELLWQESKQQERL